MNAEWPSATFETALLGAVIIGAQCGKSECENDRLVLTSLFSHTSSVSIALQAAVSCGKHLNERNVKGVQSFKRRYLLGESFLKARFPEVVVVANATHARSDSRAPLHTAYCLCTFGDWIQGVRSGLTLERIALEASLSLALNPPSPFSLAGVRLRPVQRIRLQPAPDRPHLRRWIRKQRDPGDSCRLRRCALRAVSPLRLLCVLPEPACDSDRSGRDHPKRRLCL